MARVVVVDALLLTPEFGVDASWTGDGHETVIPDGFSPEELLPYLADAAALLTAHAPVTSAMIDAAPVLRLIAKPGAGVDNIDITAARERGLTVTNVPGARARAVAEHALFMMMYLARHGWMRDDPAWQGTTSIQMGGKNLGIVGLGAIGSHLARCGHGLGMRVIAATRSPDPSRIDGVDVSFVHLSDLLSSSDVVVLCVPLTPATHGLIDRDALASMKPDAFLINVARGPVVRTADLTDAVCDGHLGGVGLDVTDPEPLPPDHPLRSIPRVLLSPHNAGRTFESQTSAMARMRENVRRVLAGDEPLDPVG